MAVDIFYHTSFQSALFHIVVEHVSLHYITVKSCVYHDAIEYLLVDPFFGIEVALRTNLSEAGLQVRVLIHVIFRINQNAMLWEAFYFTQLPRRLTREALVSDPSISPSEWRFPPSLSLTKQDTTYCVAPWNVLSCRSILGGCCGQDPFLESLPPLSVCQAVRLSACLSAHCCLFTVLGTDRQRQAVCR